MTNDIIILLIMSLFYHVLLGNLIQVTHERSRQSRSRLGSLGGKVESKKEGVRQCFLFTKHLLITSRTSGGKLHFAKVSQRHHSFTKMEFKVYLSSIFFFDM